MSSHPDDLLRFLAERTSDVYWTTDDKGVLTHVAAQIRRDKIDILVDLMGHFGKRLLIFARRPAALRPQEADYELQAVWFPGPPPLLKKARALLGLETDARSPRVAETSR